MTWTPDEMQPDFIDDVLLVELRKKLEDDFRRFEVSATNNHHIGDLRRYFSSGSLAIVLGAGVSQSLGVPLWSGLVEKLLETLGVPETDKGDLIQAVKTRWLGALALARYVETQAAYRSTFGKILHSALYSTVDLKGHTDPTFSSILKLCRTIGTPGIHRILTYNFDDLLELHAKNGSPAVQLRSINCDDDDVNTGTDELTKVYHVHGSLMIGDAQPAGPLIFSERFYHHAYYDWSSFSNRIQLDTFAKFNCLFVGVSLSDPNMRRLLDLAKQHGQRKHYMIVRSRFLSDGSSTRSAKFLDFVSEKDALHFGIKPLWVDEFSCIPQVLDEIGR